MDSMRETACGTIYVSILFVLNTFYHEVAADCNRSPRRASAMAAEATRSPFSISNRLVDEEGKQYRFVVVILFFEYSSVTPGCEVGKV